MRVFRLKTEEVFYDDIYSSILDQRDQISYIFNKLALQISMCMQKFETQAQLIVHMNDDVSMGQ